jgi:hypothetical protein
MNHSIILCVILISLGCKTKTDCCKELVATGKTMTEKKNGDWNQYYLNDTIWFEYRNNHTANGEKKCDLVNYNRCGEKQNEGTAVYDEHPIMDYSKVGKWKIYSCE